VSLFLLVSLTFLTRKVLCAPRCRIKIPADLPPQSSPCKDKDSRASAVQNKGLTWADARALTNQPPRHDKPWKSSDFGEQAINEEKQPAPRKSTLLLNPWIHE
jgi:hypothetical protein